MKKIIVAAFLMMGSAGAFAQAGLGIGVKGGLNFANLDGTSASNTYNSRTGYHFGAFALFKFGKVGLQPELLFSKQGSKVQKPNTGDFDANFNYINIPVIVKLYTIAGINLQVGPQFGFLSRAELEGETQEVVDSFKDSDISLAMGAGWDLPFGLKIDARYNLGLTKISDNASYANVKNQVWQVSLGYTLFKLGK